MRPINPYRNPIQEIIDRRTGTKELIRILDSFLKEPFLGFPAHNSQIEIQTETDNLLLYTKLAGHRKLFSKLGLAAILEDCLKLNHRLIFIPKEGIIEFEKNDVTILRVDFDQISNTRFESLHVKPRLPQLYTLILPGQEYILYKISIEVHDFVVPLIYTSIMEEVNGLKLFFQNETEFHITDTIAHPQTILLNRETPG